MKIEKGKRIRLRAMLKVVDGDVIEKSVVEYFQGSGKMLPGLERQLEGLEPGAKKKGVIKAKNAFGDPSLHPVKKVKRTEFPEDTEFEVGTTFVGQGEKDRLNVVLEVVKIDGDDIEVRLVHPLAKKDIEYEVEVLSVTDPTPPPLPADLIAQEADDDDSDDDDDDDDDSDADDDDDDDDDEEE